MRALIAFVGLLTAVVGLQAAGAPARQSGRIDSPEWVAQQIEGRDTGRDSRAEWTMRLFDRHGRVRERALLLTSLRGSAGRDDRALIRFLAPNDIKGTGFLVWEHAHAEDERFLYLPALGRVRRIAGAEAQESFVGSDLSYEDIGGRELEDYTYAFVRRDDAWTDPSGASHPAWRLESRLIDKQAQYPRTVSLVRKDNFVVVSADIYNRRDEREKRFDVRRLERIDGIWTASDIVMVNEQQRTRTELVVKQARYNIGLSESDFTRRVLEQGVR
jgi:Outer membrane lipoprotein-sorting protein